MDFNTDSVNQNEYFSSSSDNNDDSDIESRLYAEIHYANIIDDDNDLIHPIVNNDLTQDLEITSYNSTDINNLITCQESKNDSQSVESNDVDTFNKLIDKSPIYLERNLECVELIDEEDITKVPLEVNLDKSSTTEPNLNTSNNLNKVKLSNKRSVINNSSNKSIELSNKKSKHTDKSINSTNKKREEWHSNCLQNDLDNSNTNHLRDCVKKKESQQDDTKMEKINPIYNESEDCIQLSSPESSNLLCGKRLRVAKKIKNKKLKKIISKHRVTENKEKDQIIESTSNKMIDTDLELIQVDESDKEIIENNDDTTHQNNNKRYNSLNISEIIDISSECSTDSEEENFKYNMTVATDKKIKEKNIVIDDNSEESSSDCQSIFEIPVSPKPIPPVIVLKDSDNESDGKISSSNSLIVNQEDETPKRGENFLHSPIITGSDKFNIVSESKWDSDIILNCTPIEPQFSNLSEIKRSSKLSKLGGLMKDSNVIQADVTVQKKSLDIDAITIASSNIKEDNLIDSDDVKDVSTETVIKALNDKRKSKVDLSPKTISMEKYFFQPMTNKMISFYNESWGGENFSVKKLKSQMSPNPRDWLVLKDDLLNSVSHAKRYFGKVCNNCQKPGHKQYSCPEAYKTVICHMCGNKGHFDTSCLNKICLTCGVKQNMYKKTCQNCQNLFCLRCYSKGHLSNNCPDLWRRYHQTINNIKVKIPKKLGDVMKPANEVYCCNCARKGHDSINCKKRQWSQHFQNPSYVSSYKGPNYSLQLESSSDTSDVHDDIVDTVDANFDNDESDNVSSTLRAHDAKQSKDEQVRQNSSRNISTDPKDNLNIRIKSRDINKSRNNPSFKLLYLKYPCSYKSESNKLKHWQVLLNFINAIKLNMTINFLLKQSDKKINININCLRNLSCPLNNIISQFVQRNTFERSHMYLNCDRDTNTVIDHLSSKIIEMKNVDECPLELYDKIQRLFKEMGHENNWDNDLRYSLVFSKLSRYHQKLLMILYREGLADDSFKNLLKIKDSISLKQHYVQTKKLKKPLEKQLISINCLFKYLYYYNNVFAPYRPNNLSALMSRYKERIELCDRISNDTTVFLPQRTVTNRDVVSANAVERLDNYIITLNNSEPPKELPLPGSTSTSNVPMNKISVSTVGSASKQTETNTRRSNKKRNLNTFYKLSESAKDANKRKKFKAMFETFIQQTKHLMDTASKLDAPNIRNEMRILQNKMKDEPYVTLRDVKPLKKLVKRLKQSRQKHQNTNNT